MESSYKSFEIYTLGIWIIKPGKETEFISKWTSFAQWMNKNTSGTGKGSLLQDAKNPLRFISFGPWKSESDIQAWRDSNEFKNFVAGVMPVCDDFQPNTLNLVSTSE